MSRSLSAKRFLILVLLASLVACSSTAAGSFDPSTQPGMTTGEVGRVVLDARGMQPMNSQQLAVFQHRYHVDATGSCLGICSNGMIGSGNVIAMPNGTNSLQANVGAMPEGTTVTAWLTIGGVTTYETMTIGGDTTIIFVNNLPSGQAFTFGFYDSTGAYTGMITDSDGETGEDQYNGTGGACGLCHGEPLLSGPRP